jgi:hypothetical protein
MLTRRSLLKSVAAAFVGSVLSRMPLVGPPVSLPIGEWFEYRGRMCYISTPNSDSPIWYASRCDPPDWDTDYVKAPLPEKPR